MEALVATGLYCSLASSIFTDVTLASATFKKGNHVKYRVKNPSDLRGFNGAQKMAYIGINIVL